MKLIKREIYFTGITTIPPLPPVTTNTPFPVGNTIAKKVPITVPSNPPASYEPSSFQIPLLLEQSFEDIGIYTDFLYSNIYDGNGLMGVELTTNQIQYIIDKRPEVLNYSQGVQFWWDEIGKFEKDNNRIRVEELIGVESKIISTSKQTISPSTSLDIKSLTFYSGNEIELDFRVRFTKSFKYVIKLNNYIATYTPQNFVSPSDLVKDISNFISTEPTFAPLGVTTQFIENKRTENLSGFVVVNIDTLIKISALNEKLIITPDIVTIINNDNTSLTYSQITGLTETIFNTNNYKLFYSDQPVIPNTTIVSEKKLLSPYTIYSSMTTGLSGSSIDNFYITDFLGHEYSSTTANWEINKSGYINYFSNKHIITGITTQRLNEVSTYDNVNPIQKGINGVIQVNNQFTSYTINNINYITYSGNELFTTYSLISDGFNSNNISLDNIIKEEYLDGVVFPPTIKNNVEIERQKDSIMDSVFRVNQIKNVNEFTTYDNGFYLVDNQTIGIKHTT